MPTQSNLKKLLSEIGTIVYANSPISDDKFCLDDMPSVMEEIEEKLTPYFSLPSNDAEQQVDPHSFRLWCYEENWIASPRKGIWVKNAAYKDSEEKTTDQLLQTYLSSIQQ